jgi:hypothetical protein
MWEEKERGKKETNVVHLYKVRHEVDDDGVFRET